MKLEDLNSLCEAIKYQSISIAAEKNYTSQSTYSTAINRLEKEIGVELLVRSSKGVVPTQFGEEFAKKAENVLVLVREMKEIVDIYNFTDSLKLATSFAISEGLMPYCVNKISENGKDVDYFVSVMEDYKIYDSVAAGHTRLGIGIYDSTLLRGDLTFTPLFQNEYLVHVGPKSPLYAMEEVTYEELIKEPYIAFGDEFLKNEANYWPREKLSKEDMIFNYRINSTGAIKRMIVESRCFCVLPEFNSRSDLYVTSGLIKTMRIKDTPLPITYGYIENSRYKLGNIEKYFIKILKQVIAENAFFVDV